MGAEQQPMAAVRGVTREDGRRTRRALLDAAASRFRERGLGGVALAEVARAAGTFPSQVTYHFGSKEGLFVAASCREALHVAREVERAGARATDLEAWVRAIVDTALGSPGLLPFVEAMLLVRRRTDLAPVVEATFVRLHEEGERAVREVLDRHGWPLRTTPADEARAFWSAVIGVALERAVVGDALSAASAEAAVRVVLHLHDRSGDAAGPAPVVPTVTDARHIDREAHP